MRIEPIIWTEYFKCPLCGAEFRPATFPDKSVTVWERPNGEKFCSEQCADTDLQIEQREREQGAYEQWRAKDHSFKLHHPDSRAERDAYKMRGG